MKRSLAHLPVHKRRHLKYVAGMIREMIPDVQMIILFGSHARGGFFFTPPQNVLRDAFLRVHSCCVGSMTNGR